MIVIGDIHLGKSNDSIMRDGVPSQLADIKYRLWHVLQMAEAAEECIVVAGDIFNRVNPTSLVVSTWFEWLAECRKSRVTVFLIPGNHDAGVDWTNLSMVEKADLPNVWVFSEPHLKEVQEDGTSRNVLFWPHLPLARREAIEAKGQTVSEWVADQFPSAELIVTHGQLHQSDYVNDIFFEAGDAMVIDLEPFKKLKLMVAAHIHDHRRYGKLVYPGSLTINNFGEVDESKGYISVDLESLKWEWTEFSEDGVTPWQHVVLDLTEKDETSLKEEDIRKAVIGAVVKITVQAKKHGVVNEAYIRSLFNKYGVVTRFETVVADYETQVSEGERKLSHKELLKDWLGEREGLSESEKALTLKLGSRIIQEVVS